jgi:hypothetical protein
MAHICVRIDCSPQGACQRDRHSAHRQRLRRRNGPTAAPAGKCPEFVVAIRSNYAGRRQAWGPDGAGPDPAQEVDCDRWVGLATTIAPRRVPTAVMPYLQRTLYDRAVRWQRCRAYGAANPASRRQRRSGPAGRAPAVGPGTGAGTAEIVPVVSRRKPSAKRRWMWLTFSCCFARQRLLDSSSSPVRRPAYCRWCGEPRQPLQG